jgi:hypothetical protein
VGPAWPWEAATATGGPCGRNERDVVASFDRAGPHRRMPPDSCHGRVSPMGPNVLPSSGPTCPSNGCGLPEGHGFPAISATPCSCVKQVRVCSTPRPVSPYQAPARLGPHSHTSNARSGPVGTEEIRRPSPRRLAPCGGSRPRWCGCRRGRRTGLRVAGSFGEVPPGRRVRGTRPRTRQGPASRPRERKCALPRGATGRDGRGIDTIAPIPGFHRANPAGRPGRRHRTVRALRSPARSSAAVAR